MLLCSGLTLWESIKIHNVVTLDVRLAKIDSKSRVLTWLEVYDTLNKLVKADDLRYTGAILRFIK